MSWWLLVVGGDQAVTLDADDRQRGDAELVREHLERLQRQGDHVVIERGHRPMRVGREQVSSMRRRRASGDAAVTAIIVTRTSSAPIVTPAAHRRRRKVPSSASV